jgi:hypothetical protein
MAGIDLQHDDDEEEGPAGATADHYEDDAGGDEAGYGSSFHNEYGNYTSSEDAHTAVEEGGEGLFDEAVTLHPLGRGRQGGRGDDGPLLSIRRDDEKEGFS